jgi:hypothetical protein
MATVDSTSFDAALKEYYTDDTVEDVVSEGNTWFGLISKDAALTGDTFVQPIQWGVSQGRSADIAKALSRKGTNKYSKFNVTTADDYASISIGRKVMKQSGNMRGAFFEAKTREVDGMLKSLTRSLAWGMFRNSGGSMGRVSTTVAVTATVITLNESEDVSSYEADQVLVASLNDGSVAADVLRAGDRTITAVDEDAGTLTTTGTITGLTTSDFLFVDGDFGVKVSGFGSWMSIRNDAAATPGATTFFGVDRSQHVTRLAGQRITATGDPMLEAIPRGARRLARGSQTIDTALCSHQKFEDLLVELGNRTEMTTYEATPTVAYSGVKIRGPNGPIEVFADRNCPDKFCFLIKRADWSLKSHGPVPDLHDEDGVRMLRDTGADSFEVRASYYAQTVTANTAAMAVLTLE